MVSVMQVISECFNVPSICRVFQTKSSIAAHVGRELLKIDTENAHKISYPKSCVTIKLIYRFRTVISLIQDYGIINDSMV